MRVLKSDGKAFFGIPIEPAPNQPLNSPDHYHFWVDEKSILKLFNGLNVISTKLIKPNLIVELKNEIKLIRPFSLWISTNYSGASL